MAGPLRLAVEAPDEPIPGVRTLRQPFALVGRDQRADILLEHPLVSRRHAYLQVVEGHLFWIDLESRHGIETGAGLRRSGWLTADRKIRVGPHWIRRLTDEESPEVAESLESPPESSPLIARSYGPDPWPEVALEFLNGPSRSSVLPVNRVVSLIGSAAGCKFRLTDPSVDPFHCGLTRTAAGVWVVDFSGGGVSVNGEAARVARLADGDVLALGRYRTRVRVRDQARGLRVQSPAPALSPPDPPTSRTTLAAREAAPTPAMASRRSEGEPARAEFTYATEILAAGGEEGRISESVLVPLVNQFGIMQQQMLDQFQSAMGMLVEMFGSLQREQMDLIRQELDQLREVTREFQELKVELATLSRDRASAAASPASPEPAPPQARTEPQEERTPEAPFSTTTSTADETTDERAAKEAEPSRRPKAKAGRGDADDADDIMLWLNQRIATLQEERESRWRKILKLLPNAS